MHVSQDRQSAGAVNAFAQIVLARTGASRTR